MRIPWSMKKLLKKIWISKNSMISFKKKCTIMYKKMTITVNKNKSNNLKEKKNFSM